ncbi:helix-turn-helix domain-containing protein [Ornithinibacillus sp. L9]|uniref:Helix-turn-helix domain-containing protein n=1 Tax=Ornithinibacillus caprae TaxID=2678566 RepID=A0A6N8FM69_9BACI|nr:AraC family transcriptional regulator [Ornithinibacillus caprae]MUK89816.1 helix-turn-helix domain-containing protein [Ornithinibacillus caprae]
MTNGKTEIVLQAIEYMKTHLEEEITSEQLAKHVGYSPYHFSRVFKEVTGVSPRHYLSALRIETGKQILVNSSSTILKTLLDIGFRSMGTFNSKFKRFVGIPPKQFQSSIHELHHFVNEYQFSTKTRRKVHPPSITCHLEVPSDFKGVLFVGLFPRPIPDQNPVVGTALAHHETSCTFSTVPKGTYYILAAAISRSLNPKNYFVLDKALRGIAEHPVTIQDDTESTVSITLRNPLPYDPPILINLPKLLLEKEKNSKQEEK